jgi:hypothetical protein
VDKAHRHARAHALAQCLRNFHIEHRNGVARLQSVGILPIYVAVAMGVLIFDSVFSDAAVRLSLWLGFILPFVAGLWGTASLYRGFSGLADTLPEDRCERRSCFLRRLVFSWGVCYTAIAPVMIFTVWQSLQSLF